MSVSYFLAEDTYGQILLWQSRLFVYKKFRGRQKAALEKKTTARSIL